MPIRSALLVSGLAFTLAACVPPQSASRGTAPTATAQKPAAAAKPAPRPATKSKTKKKAAAKPTPKAQSLVGRSVANTRDILGKPLMVRREKGAALWLYSAGRCNLHILTNATNRGEVVRDLQFRDSKTQRSFGPDSDAGRYCFEQIVDAKKG